MKKVKLLKPILLLLAVFTFSMCDESDPIEFIVKKDVETSITVNGLKGESAYSVTSVADVSGLVGTGTSFVEADIKTVSLRLQDYSGTSIEGNIKLTTNGIILLDKDVTLTTTNQTITIPAGASGILDAINSGSLAIALEGSTTVPIEDDEFKIVVTPTVTGTVTQ